MQVRFNINGTYDPETNKYFYNVCFPDWGTSFGSTDNDIDHMLERIKTDLTAYHDWLVHERDKRNKMMQAVREELTKKYD